MPRLTNLDEIMFPVEEHPVFVSMPTKLGERRLPVPDKKALVNAGNGRVLGVVSRGYRMVPNSKALDWACQCCCLAFPESKPGEWQVTAIDAPRTGSYCNIDLMHNTAALDFSMVSPQSRPEAFGPFVRVTNSYNGLRALTFDIGLYRKVCKNGMILPDAIIHFKYAHLSRDIGREIAFEIDHARLEKVKTVFNDYMDVLRECAVPRAYFLPLLKGVLHINEPKNITTDRKIEDAWKALSSHLEAICYQYIQELGENAYSAFNAITDFASHPPENRCVYRDRHSYQQLAGAWLSRFHDECRQMNFSLSDYLVKLASGDEKRN
ncbi:MAG: DUF932 domain-containing protein [Syntrophaceae bacterium]|jgi:hypothetical protein|nr:DUF932 domain-containing protein [Syntrophaceae bacterium]